MSTRFSLLELGISPGQSRHEVLDLAVRPYKQGGIDYHPSPDDVEARLDITAMHQGYDFRLRFATSLYGPCARCLEDAVVPVEIDVHEVHDPASEQDELVSTFVTGDELDVSGWAQEAVGLQFPPRVLCNDDCRGLCPSCGANRNEETCDCQPPPPDSRWEKLRELQLGED